MGWGNALQTIASAIVGGAPEVAERNPEYGGTPPFQYDPNHPYYRKSDDEDTLPSDHYGITNTQSLKNRPGSPYYIPQGDDLLQRTQSPLGDSYGDVDRRREFDRPGLERVPQVPRGTTPSDPGPAQQNPTSKASDADALALKDYLGRSMENLRRLESIDPNDREVMATYGHKKKYEPGTMKKRNGVMVDVGGETKKDSMLGNIGKGLLLSMKNIAPVLMDKNVSNRDALGYAIGAAAGGGIRNGMDGTLDEQAKLERDKARAQQQVAGAQGAYDKNIANRMGEANIAWTEARPDIANEANKIKANAELGKVYERKTKRLKTFIDGMRAGTFDLRQNGQFMDTMADLAGVDEIKIGDFNPLTDTIIRTETVTDADTGTTYAVTYNKGGKVVTEKAVDKATGQPIKVKTDRVYAADKTAATQITTTGMRNATDKEIATMNNNAKMWIEKLQIGTKEKGMIYDEFVRLSSLPENASKLPNDLMSEALTNVGSAKPTP